MLISFLIVILSFLPLITRAIPIPQSFPPVPIDFLGPERCMGNCSHIHDPSIIYEDGLYWRFSTSGNIAIATARDLHGPWTYQGPLLQNGTRIHIRHDQDVWAPSITKIGDLFYCHYSVSYMGSQYSKIGVATSTSLKLGNWTDHGALGFPQNRHYNLIDPYVFQENSKAPIYFTFGSYWSGIHQVEIKEEKQLIFWSGQESDIINVVRNSTKDYAVVEGANVHKHEDYYYMFFSVGQCCRTETSLVPPGDEYHVAVCRADKATGPFMDANGKNCLTESGGTTILASHGDIYAPGGQGVMVDPKSGKSVIYYHYVHPSVGYGAEQFFFGFNYLEWKDAWPVLVSPGS